MSTYGTPRSAAGPSGRNTSFTPGCATGTRSEGTPRVSVTSRAVYSEIAKRTSHVAAAFSYLRECIANVLGVTHSR